MPLQKKLEESFISELLFSWTVQVGSLLAEVFAISDGLMYSLEKSLVPLALRKEMDLSTRGTHLCVLPQTSK